MIILKLYLPNYIVVVFVYSHLFIISLPRNIMDNQKSHPAIYFNVHVYILFFTIALVWLFLLLSENFKLEMRPLGEWQTAWKFGVKKFVSISES